MPMIMPGMAEDVKQIKDALQEGRLSRDQMVLNAERIIMTILKLKDLK